MGKNELLCENQEDKSDSEDLKQEEQIESEDNGFNIMKVDPKTDEKERETNGNNCKTNNWRSKLFSRSKLSGTSSNGQVVLYSRNTLEDRLVRKNIKGKISTFKKRCSKLFNREDVCCE